MTKPDLMAGVACKPRPFTVHAGTSDAFEVLLRPLMYGDRSAVLQWHRENKERPQRGAELQKKLVALAVCDLVGKLLLSEVEVDTLDPNVVDEIADEVAVRSGIREKAGAPDPKAEPPAKAAEPTTPTS